MGEWMYRSKFSWPRHYLEVSGKLHAPAALSPGGSAPSTHRTGCWVDPRTGLDEVEKRIFLTLPRLELRPLGRQAPSQSQYRLRYISPQRNNERFYMYIYAYDMLRLIQIPNMILMNTNIQHNV
jgi:hypothetical protein